MSIEFQSQEGLSDSQIFKEIENFSLLQNRDQVLNKMGETLQKYQHPKIKTKNKTLPPSNLLKYHKVSEFEKLIHTEVTQLIKKKFIIDLYRGVKYSIKSLIGPHESVIYQKRVELKEPAKSKRKFLFLDLDETLIFTERQKPSKFHTNEISFKIFIRPHTQQFLSNLSNHYNIYVFTAATKEYAEAVINKLDPKKKILHDFLCRDHCFETKRGKIIKDLRIVKNRELKEMILVDNKPESFGLQIDNGIPILDFYGSNNDVELKHLEKVLIQLAKLDDVRTGISDRFRLKELAVLSKEDLQQYLKKGTSLGNSEKKMKELLKN